MSKNVKKRHFIMIKSTNYEKGRFKVNLFGPSNIKAKYEGNTFRNIGVTC